ncbi:MAG: lytic murein transglycosylase [Deltaproteobacteria bacterium]|jgi:membrane-bound lytic murein transglycosylase B|nr:lytic murein transglycosylase [Deltaproteobacteria bacterium]
MTIRGGKTGRNLALLLLLLVGVLSVGLEAIGAMAVSQPFDHVQSRLIADGFDAERVRELYRQPEVVFESRGVALFFRHSEARLNYGQFLEERRLAMARQYVIDHSGALAAAEAQYDVPREIITAIMLVETQLGTLVGNQTVFNILSTMAALEDTTVRKAFWSDLPTERRLKRKAFEKKADRKSLWAYNELKALLRYVEAEKMDPVTIQGSYAGAMGYCQFMPSNVLRLGVDGNGDERVDLFDHTDAIASVGNYLKHHGWKPGMTRQQQYQVILKYNYSKPYANTILDIAARLSNG